MLKTANRFLGNKLLIFIILAVVAVLSFVSLLLLTPHTTKANPTSADSDFEVSISEVLAFSLTNCDSTNSSVVNIE